MQYYIQKDDGESLIPVDENTIVRESEMYKDLMNRHENLRLQYSDSNKTSSHRKCELVKIEKHICEHFLDESPEYTETSAYESLIKLSNELGE